MIQEEKNKDVKKESRITLSPLSLHWKAEEWEPILKAKCANPTTLVPVE